MEEIPQIKDKITARAYALYLSNSHRILKDNVEESIIDRAKNYTDFLIGNAELPEVAEDPSTQMLSVWNKLKESMEKNETEMSKRLEELHSKIPFRANCYTEPKIEDIQNEAH